MTCPRTFSTSDIDAGWEYAGRGLGAFIHYGINTYVGESGFGGTANADPATEWPASSFAPTAPVDIKQWLLPSVMCGATYAIFTAKHHFGWCAWPTASTTYDIASGSGAYLPTDLVQDFIDACDHYGLKKVLYFSAADRLFDHDTYRTGGTAGETYMKSQLAELLGDYGDIDAIWIDAVGYFLEDGTSSVATAYNIYDYIKSLQPNCVVLSNHGSSFISDGCTDNKDIADGRSDIAVGENLVVPDPYYLPFETVARTNRSTAWFALGADMDPDTSAETIADEIAHNLSNGAAYALNLAPGPSGEVSVSQAELMREIAVLRGRISESIGVSNASENDS